jgi:hypothetical protein
MSCSCDLNQTPKESHDALRANAKTLGTGIFLIPAPDKGILEYGGVIVPGISYIECVKRGQNCAGFKWIADTHMSHKDIMNERAAKAGCLYPNCLPGFPCTDATCICSGGNCYKV